MKKLNHNQHDIILHSMERMCKVVNQKIIKGQELNGIDILNDIDLIYIDLINLYPQIKNELKNILNSQFNHLLFISKNNKFLMITKKLENSISNLK